MQPLWPIYHPEMPEFIHEMAHTPVMLRLKGVGMHCGCEYAAFPHYAGTRPYSRWEHSVGVALIVWHFTGDMAQAAAGLLHDAASPTFAHAVDFMNGDHIAQESTEDETEAIIAASPELTALLRRYGLTLAQVCDYHIYPVADNDSPKLSADRLEYTLGNTLLHGMTGADRLKAIYDDLTAAPNEHGEPELQFRTPALALEFSRHSLANSRIYACDENRYAMEVLAGILRDALKCGAIAPRDIRGAEVEVIAKLRADGRLRPRWEQYARFASILRRAERPDDGGHWLKLDVKRRYIDPLVSGKGRTTALFPDYSADLEQFRSEKYDYWMCAQP